MSAKEEWHKFYIANKHRFTNSRSEAIADKNKIYIENWSTLPKETGHEFSLFDPNNYENLQNLADVTLKHEITNRFGDVFNNKEKTL